MGNMLDYLAWRGDLTLAQDPFNDIDNLLLACLSYVRFEGIVPGVGEGCISLREAADTFFERYSPEELKADRTFTNFAPDVLKALVESKRFGDIKLRNFVDHIDQDREKQFSAIEILTNDGYSYVSIRGTDDTIIGWKEDFNLSYQTIPADEEAVAYLNYIMQSNHAPIRVGGHSKGAHIAIYASAFCYPDIRSRIETVYENDGPGFREDMMQMPELLAIAPKIKRFIPATSIIGTLMGHFAEPVIVQSTENGVMQHNPVSWQVMGPCFETLGEESRMGRMFHESFNTWISSVEPQFRKGFVDDMFDVLLAPGVETLSELGAHKAKNYRVMKQRLDQIDENSRQIFDMLLRILIGEWGEEYGLRLQTIIRSNADERRKD